MAIEKKGKGDLPQAEEQPVPQDAHPEAGLDQDAAVEKAQEGPIMVQCLYCARYFEEGIMGLHHDVCRERPNDADITPEQAVAHSPAGLRPGSYFLLKDRAVKVPYTRRWLEERCDVYENATPELRAELEAQGLAFWRKDYFHQGNGTFVTWNSIMYRIAPGNNRLPNVVVDTYINSVQATQKAWDDLARQANSANAQGGTLWAPGAGFLVPLSAGGESSGDVQIAREV